jgi:hypothetical protein
MTDVLNDFRRGTCLLLLTSYFKLIRPKLPTMCKRLVNTINVSLISLLLPVIARFCLLLLAPACYSALLIVYLNVLDFSFKIKTTTFYFTSKVELVRQLNISTVPRNPHTNLARRTAVNTKTNIGSSTKRGGVCLKCRRVGSAEFLKVCLRLE